MDYVSKAFSLLPERLMCSLTQYKEQRIEELRLRVGQRASALIAGEERVISPCSVTERDILSVLERATGASLHSVAYELRHGYISVGGVRIGVCGAAAVSGGEVRAFRSYTSLNIRIPAAFVGELGEACSLVGRDMRASMLVISPPGGGKTTALRELIRRTSNAGARVAVVDERGELAALDGAETGFDLGAKSDVLSGVKKSQGALMLLRAMNPDYIAMDEITESADLAAIREINGCGVGLLATAHAQSAATLCHRALYRALLQEEIFDYALEIRSFGGKRTYTCRSLRA